MSSSRDEKPRHLGRGLEALLSPIISAPAGSRAELAESTEACNFPPDNKLRQSLEQISIKGISPNPYQVRSVWDEAELKELADSILANGMIQPVLVRRVGTGHQLIAGERRFRAAQMASLETIPAIVQEASEEQMFEWALVENIHRKDLNPIERAKAYQRYLNTFSLTQAQASERLGEDRSAIANFLRLLDLPDEIKQMLADGRLSMGHARAILALPTDELRRKLANRALAGRLSVREIEHLVRRYLQQAGQAQVRIRTKSSHIMDLEDRLTRQLGTKVTISTVRNGQRGRIVIEFNSLDEFDRITERMGVVCAEEV